MKKYYQVDYDQATNQPIMDELTYDKFSQMLELGWSFVYDDVSVYITVTKQCGVNVLELTTESSGITERHSYLTAKDLLSHGKICGKTFFEIWEDLYLM